MIAHGSQGWLVVPADTMPLTGSADLEVSGGDLGPLCLRLAFGVWLAEGRFDKSRRTAVLEEQDVRGAADRWRIVVAGQTAGTVEDREVDGDPELVDWQETLAAARAALAETGQSVS